MANEAAAAGFLGVGILEDEALPIESVGKVELGADQIDVRLLVHHDFHAILLDDLVRLALLIGDVKIVGQAGATAALHGDAEADIVGDALFLGKVLDFLGGLFGDFYGQFGAVLRNGHEFVTSSREFG